MRRARLLLIILIFVFIIPSCRKPDPQAIASELQEREYEIKKPSSPPLRAILAYTGSDSSRAHLVKTLIESHWNTRVEVVSWTDLHSSEMEKADVVIVWSQNFFQIPSGERVDRLGRSGRQKVFWVGYANESFLAGFGLSSEGIREVGFRNPKRSTVEYQGGEFELSSSDYLRLGSWSARTEILGMMHDRVNRLASPAVVRVGPLTYFAYLPVLFGVDDSLPFLNLLHSALGEHPRKVQVLLRLEDINAITYTSTLKLGRTLDHLHQIGVPVSFAVIPVYLNPEKGIRAHLSSNGNLVSLLKKEVKRHRGTVVVHGYTHQRESGVSGIDFEFRNFPGSLPEGGNSADRARERIHSALAALAEAGLTSEIWETPHYEASEADYAVFKSIFPFLYERFRIGNWEIVPPFAVKSGRVCFIPENLGYEEKSEDIGAIIQQARLIMLGFDDPTLGFFWHPHIETHHLLMIITGLRGLAGSLELPMEFIPPSELFNAGRGAGGSEIAGVGFHSRVAKE